MHNINKKVVQTVKMSIDNVLKLSLSHMMAALQTRLSQFVQFRKHICFSSQLLKNLWPELIWFQFDFHWYLDADEEEGGRERMWLKRKNRCKEKRVETPLLFFSLPLFLSFLLLHSCFSVSSLSLLFLPLIFLAPALSHSFPSLFTGFLIPPFFSSISSHLRLFLSLCSLCLPCHSLCCPQA